MDLTKSILTKEQQRLGFEIADSEDFVVLSGMGKTLTYNSKTVTVNKIREDADQIMNEQKSGISYEKVN